jgi:acetyltransferase-like isoleucine patch superfamily enzyme
MNRISFYWSINWRKTIYFNFKMFGFKDAIKLPVYFFGRIKLYDLTGKITIESPIKTGMIGIGQPFELTKASQGTAEFYLKGNLIFKNHAHFGKDCLIYIGENATCEIGDLFAMGSRGKLLCYHNISFEKCVRIGFESQVIDTNFHTIIDLETNQVMPMRSKISIGNYNWIGNRSSIMQKTITPDNCIVASNSLCNKDYSSFGENILIGGVPANLIRKNIKRNWDGEMENLKKWMRIK